MNIEPTYGPTRPSCNIGAQKKSATYISRSGESLRYYGQYFPVGLSETANMFARKDGKMLTHLRRAGRVQYKNSWSPGGSTRKDVSKVTSRFKEQPTVYEQLVVESLTTWTQPWSVTTRYSKQ